MRYIHGILIFVFSIIIFVFYFVDVPYYIYPLAVWLWFLPHVIMYLRRRQQEKASTQQVVAKELQIAKRVQEGLLSVSKPVVPGLKIARRCVAADNIGGDFYTFSVKDVQEFSQEAKTPGVIEYRDATNQYLGIVIGDVAGHGVSSALVMALASGLISELGKKFQSPEKLLQTVNNDLCKYILNSQISHVTAFCVAFQVSAGQFVYSNAGHHPALLVTKEGRVYDLTTDGVFLGMFPDEIYEESIQSFNSKDRLFLFTDGLIEAKNSEKEEFGLERLKALINFNKDKPIDELLQIIFETVADFSLAVELSDDQTMVIIEAE